MPRNTPPTTHAALPPPLPKGEPLAIAYVVTEGPLDVEWLPHALPPERLEGVRFVAGGELSATESLASTLLVSRRCPIAVVIDGGSELPKFITERRLATEEIIGLVAAPSRFKVIPAVPTLEMLADRPNDDPQKAALLQEVSDFLRYAHEMASQEAGASGKGKPTF